MFKRLIPERFRREKQVKQPEFDKNDFFKFVNDYINHRSYIDSKDSIKSGVTEYFIVDYFRRFVFGDKQVLYSKEYNGAIHELLLMNKDNFTPVNEKDIAEFIDVTVVNDVLRLYLTLAYPFYDPRKEISESIREYNEYLAMVLGIF